MGVERSDLLGAGAARKGGCAYEHRDYGGQMLRLTSDSPDLRQFAGPGRDRTWNDAASSIRLLNAP